jgi:ribosomal protein L11 methylase PrmA
VKRSPSSHQPLDPILKARPFRVHLLLLDRADIVDVDIDREAVHVATSPIRKNKRSRAPRELGASTEMRKKLPQTKSQTNSIF